MYLKLNFRMPIISEDVKILDFKLLEIQKYLAIQLKTKLENISIYMGCIQMGTLSSSFPLATANK